jgi:hypothetical protein
VLQSNSDKHPRLVVVLGVICGLGALGGLLFAPADLRGQEPFALNGNMLEERAGGLEVLAGNGGEEDEIETDRDSYTPATSVVGRRRLVVESAYSFIDNRHVPETHSFPELIARYGWSERLELRVGWNYEVGGAGNLISGNVPDVEEEEMELERESRMLFGTKLALTQQRGWLPSSAAILQGYTPTSGRANDSSISASYIMGWELTNRWVWDSGLRFSTSSAGEDHFNAWSPSTVLKMPIGERWRGHIEYFSVFTQGRDTESTQHFFSPGLHYLITRDWEVGLRVGWGLNEQSPNFFTNVGLGIRY